MRTRLAPSPTGFLHVGNARTFLLTWLHARAADGEIVLRVDDLDGPRVRAEATTAALADLHWLGLDWDESLEVLVQSARGEVYAAALDRLIHAGAAYPCVCTRSEVESAASAPHGLEGPRYPGTCRDRFASRDEAERTTGRPAAIRFRVPDGTIRFTDGLFGRQAFDVAEETGDFVVGKSNGTAAYHLATVVDDAASGVDLVMRGADLLSSTARQLLLLQALELPEPAYVHVPLVVGADGRRLAKRHGDTTIASLRDQGWSAPALVGCIAATAGLCRPDEAVSPHALRARYDVGRLSREPVVFDPAAFRRALA